MVFSTPGQKPSAPSVFAIVGFPGFRRLLKEIAPETLQEIDKNKIAPPELWPPELFSFKN
jgi:hypothetical protein